MTVFVYYRLGGPQPVLNKKLRHRQVNARGRSSNQLLLGFIESYPNKGPTLTLDSTATAFSALSHFATLLNYLSNCIAALQSVSQQ